MNTQCYIIAAKRSPIAPRDGVLASHNIHQLSSPVIHSLLKSVGVAPSQVDEIIAGNALGAGGNPARLIGLAAGLNESVAGLSVDRQCCSGLDAILLAHDMISSGRASIVIAGGVESYSQRPHRFRTIPGSTQLEAYDQPPFVPWPDQDPNMAEAADALAQSLGISFEQQNQWAIQSHAKALQVNHPELVQIDDVKQDSFTRALNKKTCARAKRLHGSITAANTSVAADGAAFCLVVSGAVAKNINAAKLRILAGNTLGANPKLPGLAPVAAIEKTLGDIEHSELMRIEIMEAYAAQAIACVKQTNLSPENCNLGGGSLARGHPIGASGAVLVARLYSEMQSCQGLGLAAIAAAGGLGTALLVESA